MRRLLADWLVLATALIVILLAAVFAYLRSIRQSHSGNQVSGQFLKKLRADGPLITLQACTAPGWHRVGWRPAYPEISRTARTARSTSSAVLTRLGASRA